MGAIPLPEGSSASETIRRLRGIDADFFGAIVGTTVVSGNWDGRKPISLPDRTAKKGFALDGTSGIGQFQKLRAAVGEYGSLKVEDFIEFTEQRGELRIRNASNAIQSTLKFNSTYGTQMTLAAGSNFNVDGGDGIRSGIIEATTKFIGGDFDAGALGEFISRKYTIASHGGTTPVDGYIWGGWAGASGGWMDITNPTDTLTTPYVVGMPPGGGSFVGLASTTLSGGLFDWTLNQAGIKLPDGSDSAPSVSFTGDGDTGMYSAGTNLIGMSAEGTNRLTIASSGLYPKVVVTGTDGSASAPAYSFESDPDTGMYLISDNILAVSTGNGGRMYWDSNGTHVVTMATTGSAANVFAHSGQSNRLYRSTSSRKYKKQVDYDMDRLADIELRPTHHWRIDDKAYRYSFISEDLEAQDPLLVDGETPNTMAILNVMAAKINRLEEKVYD